MLDEVVRTKFAFVPGIEFSQVFGDSGTSDMKTKKRHSIYVDDSHKIVGHCDEVSARITGKALD
jgi:hypothetical protein